MDPIQLPDVSGIADLSKADLEALRAQVQDNLKAIFEVDDAEVTKDHVELAKAHQAALNDIDTQMAAFEADEADFRAMREQFESPVEVETEVVDEAEITDETPTAEVEVVEEAPATEAAPALVSASTVRKTVARSTARPKAPAPAPVPEAPKASINVAPDVPGYAASAELTDMTDVAKAFIARTKGFRVGAIGRHQAGVAVIRKPFESEFVVDTGDEEDIYRAVQRAGNESRLPGGNLTAASGWCAPSETLYDLCPGGSAEGLFDLPEIQIRRGGVRHTNGPDYSSLYDPEVSGWDFTEAEVIAGVEKPCIEVECPEWEDVRLDAVGLCVSSGLLTRAAFPELVSGFTQEALIAHQHRVSAKVLGSVLTSAGAAQETGNLGSIAGGALAAVELIAERERGVRRWPMSETLEVVAPHWFRAALRADYSMRNGVDLQAVSDQTISSYFAARNLRLQYVYGWQQLGAAALTYPDVVQLLVYRAGTFVKGTADVINLSAIYDSANLKLNKYIELFFEEGVLVLQRCYGAALIEVPVCVGGITGAASNTECMAEAVVLSTTTTTTTV